MKHVRVPDLGDFKDVPVIEVLIAVGDSVAKDQPVVVVESDKATMEIPSSDAGIVATIEVKVGDKLSAGYRLFSLQTAGRRPSPEGEEITDRAERSAFPSLPPVETSASAEASREVDEQQRSEASSRNGVNTVPPAVLSSRVPKGNVLSLPAAVEAAQALSSQRVYAGPAVRAMARELGVDLHQVVGSGPRGRIVVEDLRRYIKAAMRTSSVSGGGAPFAVLPWPKVDYAKFGPIDQQPLSRIRRISGANLHRNWVTIPHVTNHDDADVTELEAFRAELNRDNEKTGVKISPLAFIMRACVAALKAFPEFNSSLEGETLILKRYFHIGFAADTPNGLVVPVIRDADRKGITEIAKEMVELAEKARGGKLSGADMQGGSFSISSLGGIGGSYFTPIINAPEVAILGVGRTQTRVAWIREQPQPRLFLPLSLSWDHRVVDGAAAGRFNAYLVRALGDLRRLLL